MTHPPGPFQSRVRNTSSPLLAQPDRAVPPSISWSPGSGVMNMRRPQSYNTFAVLSAILAFVIPPAGIVLGHLALPQIRRTGEHGRTAAMSGTIVGYVLTAALIVGLVAWLTSDDSGSEVSAPAATRSTAVALPVSPVAPPSVVTSVAPAPVTPRVKLDLSTVTVGTCAHIEKRDVGDDALDLYATPCEHGEGVYTVVGRADNSSDCRSTYVAAPPDHSFAICLSEY